MKFEELTEQSQQAAREVLANLLQMKYQADLSLNTEEIINLCHKVRKAFSALEGEEPEIGTGGSSSSKGAINTVSSALAGNPPRGLGIYNGSIGSS